MQFSNNERLVLSRRSMLRSIAVSMFVGVCAAPSAALGQDRFGGVFRRTAAPIRYRAPRIPTRPPRVRRITPTSPPAIVTAHKARVARSVNALTVSANTARTHLRAALNTGKFKTKSGGAWNAHHVIPLKLRGHPTIAKAAQGGLNINSKSNGLRIPATRHKEIHSRLNNSHNQAQVQSLLDNLQKTRPHYTNVQVATVVRNNIRMWKYDTMKMEPLMKQFNAS